MTTARSTGGGWPAACLRIPLSWKRLNALVHPPIRARARTLASGYLRGHPEGIVVTEAAIMIETGSYQDYRPLIVAACRPEQQLERAWPVTV
ncbi:MAG: hypothetical protein WDO18_14660 [Acidobacteriota bacterium]